MKLIEPISAIVSWEDYDYQGHIALYYSLKLIHDSIMSKTEISDFVLQIESIEDSVIDLYWKDSPRLSEWFRSIR